MYLQVKNHSMNLQQQSWLHVKLFNIMADPIIMEFRNNNVIFK